MSYRIFYAAGPGNVIEAHKHWAQDRNDPSQMSLTYSGQFADFCRDIGAEAYIVSSFDQPAIYREGKFTLEHRPKPIAGAGGARYHIAEILYGLGLVATAVRFKADVAILDLGSTHYFVMSLFRLAGIRVVAVLHNSLWPSGFPPTRPVPRLIAKLNSIFFRRFASATIGVSPECVRQVQQLTRGRHGPLLQIRAQYHEAHFRDIPPPGEPSPFRIVYAGRIIRAKGVFDILDMAVKIEARAPGRVRWTLCGSGPDLEELKHRNHAMGLRADRLRSRLDVAAGHAGRARAQPPVHRTDPQRFSGRPRHDGRRSNPGRTSRRHQSGGSRARDLQSGLYRSTHRRRRQLCRGNHDID